ncbi:MAG: RICIN domain-containing protein [Ruminococcus sp.]|nr:RICIN domain-containing protein [Ruminococcus sp.]
MKKKYLFSVIMAIVMMLSISTPVPLKVSLPLKADAVTDVSNLNPVDSTYTFIKSVEGYSPECFWDVSQWTIGYGNKCPYTHTSNGVRGQKGGHTISEAEARSLFSSKLSIYVNTLKSNCSGLSMTQNQFDALLSATYNHGNVNNCPLKYYLQGQYTESEAREKYYVWCINAGTADEKGLRNRRKKEADLFFKDEPAPEPEPVPSGGEYFPKCDSGYKSLIDALDSLGIDSSKAYRKRIAEANGISDYSYSSEQNTYMLNLLKEGRLINPDGKPEPPVELPTYSNLTANKTMIAVGEEITFTASSDNATGFTIGIDNETSRYITQEMPNGQLTLTFDRAGSYGAYVTSYNSAGYKDSSWIGFTVYDSAPTYSNLNADKTIISVYEEITFTASSDLASAYWIGIDNETERYITQEMPNGKLTLTFDNEGIYTAYVTSLNPLGYADSEIVKFFVSSPCDLGNEKLVYISQTCSNLFMTADTGEFTGAHNVYGTEKNFQSSQIWKLKKQTDGSYRLLNMGNNQCMEVFNGTVANGTNISTYDETASFENQKFNFYYINGHYFISPVCTPCLVDMNPDDSHDVATYDYGDDWSSHQTFDIIEVPEFIFGDINNDLSVSVSDAVLLQKWLLSESDSELINWKSADLCEDGRLDAFDMVEMRKLIINSAK